MSPGGKSIDLTMPRWRPGRKFEEKDAFPAAKGTAGYGTPHFLKIGNLPATQKALLDKIKATTSDALSATDTEDRPTLTEQIRINLAFAHRHFPQERLSRLYDNHLSDPVLQTIKSYANSYLFGLFGDNQKKDMRDSALKKLKNEKQLAEIVKILEHHMPADRLQRLNDELNELVDIHKSNLLERRRQFATEHEGPPSVSAPRVEQVIAADNPAAGHSTVPASPTFARRPQAGSTARHLLLGSPSGMPPPEELQIEASSPEETSMRSLADVAEPTGLGTQTADEDRIYQDKFSALSSGARKLIQIAAFAEKDFDEDLVGRVLGAAAPDFSACCKELEGARLLSGQLAVDSKCVLGEQSLGNQSRWSGSGLDGLITARARVFDALMLDHPHLLRDDVQLLCDFRTDFD